MAALAAFLPQGLMDVVNIFFSAALNFYICGKCARPFVSRLLKFSRKREVISKLFVSSFTPLTFSVESAVKFRISTEWSIPVAARFEA
jgi:uncharacterized protein (DUF58 family)